MHIYPIYLENISQIQEIKSRGIHENNVADLQEIKQKHNFKDIFLDVLNNVNAQQKLASEKVSAVDKGKSDDLVGAMIASQKASLAFSGLMEVRNKLVHSFEEIYKMPV